MDNVIHDVSVLRAGSIDKSLTAEITRDALRRAALAPTYMEALDITGEALIAVATISRMEVHHA